MALDTPSSTPIDTTIPNRTTFLSTRGNEIGYTDENNQWQTVQLRGINWGGFQVEAYVPTLLDKEDYTVHIDRMKAFGFNTIRLLWSDDWFDDRNAEPPQGGLNGDFPGNDDLRGDTSLQVMDKIIAYAGSVGMRVVLDHHRNDNGSESGTGGTNDHPSWHSGEGSGYTGSSVWTPDQVTAHWAALAAHYANDPTVIGADLHNEPWGALTWDKWSEAAQQLGEAVLKANPNLLLFVEGTQFTAQDNDWANADWWGGNLRGAQTDPVRFFVGENRETEITNKLVYAPHTYGPGTIFQSWFAPDGTENFPASLEARLDEYWGYLSKNGTAPIFTGEFGGKLETAQERLWFSTLVDYFERDLDRNGIRENGQTPMSWAFWEWSPYSHDTGGFIKPEILYQSNATTDLAGYEYGKYNLMKRAFTGQLADVLGDSVAADTVGPNALSQVIDGRGGNDTIDGGGGHDLLRGGTGNDSLLGGDGDDDLWGEAGNDTLFGGTGADFLQGGAGNDSLAGGQGDDTLAGGTGADTLNGGDGTDVADYSLATTAISANLETATVTGGEGSGDVLVGIEGVTGSYYADTLRGSSGDNRISGWAGADTIYGSTGNDTIDGGKATGDLNADWLDYSALAGTVAVRFDTASVTKSAGGADHVTEIEHVRGTGNADTIVGDGAWNRFEGGGGNDSLNGGGGNDTLVGGAGDDTLVGGGGSHTSYAGGDTYEFAASGNGQDVIVGALSGDSIRILGTSLSAVSTGGAAGTGQNQVRVETVGGNTVLHIGTDSVAGSDVDITLTGSFGAANFAVNGDTITLQPADPPAATLAIGPAEIARDEGTSGSTAYTFTVTHTGAAATVNWSVAGLGSNPADAADFAGGVLPFGTLGFALGETSKTITVNVAGDALVEANETFAVTLSDPSAGTTITTTTAQGVITNDDIGFAITSGSVAQSEGSSGGTPFLYTVTRSGVTSGSQTVNWAVTGSGPNAATAADFTGGTLPSGSVTFDPNETSKTIAISVLGDSTAEADEGFTVTLTGADAGTITGATAGGTILNDDDTTTLSVAALDAMKGEGASGSTPFTFRITRGGNTTGPTSVSWSLAGSGASAANAADFTGGALPSGSVTFADGETVKDITVNVAGDTAIEANETFTVTIATTALATTIQTATATGTIVNDDALPVLNIAAADAAKAEGNSGSTAFTFTVTRSGDTSGTSSATWTVAGSGAGAADFTGGTLPSGTVSFAAGETTKTVTVNVAGDTTVETDEGFTVGLSAASGATISTASAAGTILNDDTGSSTVSQTVYGGPNGDLHTTGGGNDFIYASDGNDTVDAGAGNDQLFGQDGDDSLIGGAGVDQLFGGNGNDVLRSGAGDDYMDGGSGVDTFVATPGDGYDYIGDFASGSGGDVIDLRAWTAINGLSDLTLTQSGSDTTIGLNGSNGVTLANTATTALVAGNFLFAKVLRNGSSGDDSITGDARNDEIYGYNGRDTLTGNGGDDEIYGEDGNDLLSGGTGNDLLHGGIGNDVLDGGDGSDDLKGGEGHDLLKGGAGIDQLYGGNGNDTFQSGTGDDYMVGGNGVDTFALLPGDGYDYVADFAAGSGGDVIDLYHYAGMGNLTTVLSYASQSGADTVIDFGSGTGITLANVQKAALTGANFRFTATTVTGTSGSDILAGTEGNNIVVGLDGNDKLFGYGGDDSLVGGNGVDELYAGNGNDTVLSGAGYDYVVLGTGVDVFVFNPGDQYDYIEDFAAGFGGDVLDLRAWSAIHSLTDLQPYLGTSGSNTTISLGAGDGITLANLTPSALTSANVIFA